MSKYEIIESKYRKGGSKMLKLGETRPGIKEEKEKRELPKIKYFRNDLPIQK